MIFLTDNLEQHSDSEIDQFHVPNGIIPHHQLQVYPDNLNLKGKVFFCASRVCPTVGDGTKRKLAFRYPVSQFLSNFVNPIF